MKSSWRDAGAELNAIADRYYVEDGTRKPISYWIEYGALFEGRRDAPLRILELGVFSGASLLIWRDYLPNAMIWGVDIGGCPPRIAGKDRIRFIQCSQDDERALDSVTRAAGGAFDLIVDDASHIGYLTKRAFCRLFRRALVPGGYYAIEDFGTGFLPEYPDGSVFSPPPDDDAEPETRIFGSHQYGMVGFVKQIQDHMMQELMTGTPSPFPIERMVLRPNLALIRKAIVHQR